MTTISSFWFVCAGNICRSVIAEHAFRRFIDIYALRVNQIGSAGLIAIPGDVPIADTIRAALKAGLNLSHHRARRFIASDVPDDAVIFVMEHGQYDKVLELTGFTANKVRLLGALVPDETDEIADPENETEVGFDRCVNRIVACVEALTKAIASEQRDSKLEAR